MVTGLVSKENLFLLVVLCIFSTNLSQWHGKDSSIPEGTSIETSQFGLYEIIN